MTPFNLLIHYEPGARGDFLASILKNEFVSVGTRVLIYPPYTKIHHIRNPIPDGWGQCITDFHPIINFDGIKIRIDPGINAIDLVEIHVNHIIKNNLNYNYKSPEFFWAMYTAIRNYILLDYQTFVEHKDIYTHWILYKNLKDLDFLRNLYKSINNEDMTSKLMNEIVINIDNQIDISSDKEIKSFCKLIQFEIDNKLFNFTRRHDPLFYGLDNLNNIDEFLTRENYIMENF